MGGGRKPNMSLIERACILPRTEIVLYITWLWLYLSHTVWLCVGEHAKVIKY